MLAATTTGDAFVAAALLALAVGDGIAAVTVVAAITATVVRWGSSSLTAVAGAQAVLGPAGVTGGVLDAASSWLAAAAVALTRGPGPPFVPAGVLAGVLVAGIAIGEPIDVVVRIAVSAVGVAAAFGAARLLPTRIPAGACRGVGGRRGRVGRGMTSTLAFRADQARYVDLVDRAWPVAATAFTALWVVAAATGGDVGPLHFSALGAAAAAGTAAAVAAAWPPGEWWGRPWAGAITAPLAPLVLPVVVGLAASERSAIPLAIVAAVAGVVTGSRRHRPDLHSGGLALAGAGALLASLLSSHAARPGWHLAPSGDPQAITLLVAALGLLAATARDDATQIGLRPLTVVAVVAGISGSAFVPESAPFIAAAAVIVAVARQSRGVLLAVGAVAVAAIPGAMPAALLLGAAAVVAPAVPRAAADVLVIPGAVALVAVFITQSASTATAIAVGLLVAAATVVALGPRPTTDTHPPALNKAPGLALAGWLVVAPSTWRWTGVRIPAYDKGAAIGAATFALTAVVVTAWHAAPALRSAGLDVLWRRDPRPCSPRQRAQRARSRGRRGWGGQLSASWWGYIDRHVKHQGSVSATVVCEPGVSHDSGTT